MNTLREGSRGQYVITLQTSLKRLGFYYASIDGHFGPQTNLAVINFQKAANISIDGVVGPKTWNSITYHLGMLKIKPNKEWFTVFIDAGHGGIHPTTLDYQTNGKLMHHGLDKFDGHIKNGTYYEGLENRIIADNVSHELHRLGINTVKLYHPYKDTPLRDRINLVKSLEGIGYWGYVHSFHSNAISLSNRKDKLESTQGAIIFTTRGQHPLSDPIGQIHYENWKSFLEEKKRTNGAPWLWDKSTIDKDADMEANFQILRQAESPYIGAILEEFGFHTSLADTKFITNANIRKNRVLAAVKTAIKAKEFLQKYFKI